MTINKIILSVEFYSNNASSGDCSRNEASGKNFVIVCAGKDSQAKGVDGTLIALTHYVDNLPEKIVTGKIGTDGLKVDTWYSLDNNGKFIEVNYDD